MGEHAERAHSILSASGAHRWITCPPSALMETQFPDTTSEAAAEGTLAHELAEAKVRNYALLGGFTKKKLNAAIKKMKENPLWDDEMLDHTDTYLDYTKKAFLKYKTSPTVRVEEPVFFGKYTHSEMRNPPCEYEGYGTADCIMIGSGVIHVIDFKYGKSPDGRVAAVGNPQMMLYALGAYETYKILYPIDTIRMSIVQPRLPDGISEWEIPLAELLEHSRYIEKQAALAWQGGGEFKPEDKACKYCRVAKAGRCRARAEKNKKLVFSGDVGKLPPLITNGEMGKYLREGADLVKWYGDLKEAALKECLAGHDVPGWKAVAGRGERAWTDMDKAFEVLQKAGIDKAVLYENKPLTLAQVEKIVGKKPFADTVGEYVVKNLGKPALADALDKRSAITNRIDAAEAFREEKKDE